MKVWLIPIVSALFLASAVIAKNYGMAGCGLGSLVITSKSNGSQITAATTNGSTYSQFFGITSGTSNCTDDGVALEAKELEYFTEANYESLIQEMAQGSGENITTLAMLFGCNAEQAADFGAALQSHYNEIVPAADASYQEMLQNVSEINNQSNICTEG